MGVAHGKGAHGREINGKGKRRGGECLRDLCIVGRGVNGEECVRGSAWEGSVTKRSSRKWSVMHSVHGKECVEGKEVYGR